MFVKRKPDYDEEMIHIELEYEQDHGGVSDGQGVVDPDVDYRMDRTTEAYEEMFQYEMQHQWTN